MPPTPNEENRDRTPIDVRCTITEMRMVDGATGAKNTVRGYGIVYNRASEIMQARWGEKFREIVKPGAADRVLNDASADLTVDMHHNGEKILGRRSAGTARFGSDDTGLWFEADLPDTSYARDLKASIDRGDIKGSSFVFSTIADSWSDPDAQGIMTRTLHEVHVFNMGPVVDPAYRDTTAACRSLSAVKEQRTQQSAAYAELVRLRNEFLRAELS